jgi:hypothetical protein
MIGTRDGQQMHVVDVVDRITCLPVASATGQPLALDIGPNNRDAVLRRDDVNPMLDAQVVP